VETGDLVDEETRESLRRFLSTLAAWTQRLEAPKEAHLRQAPRREPDGPIASGSR
jgi:hypothetical protein